MNITVEYIYETFEFICVRLDNLYYKVPLSKVIKEPCFSTFVYKVNAADLVNGTPDLTYG